MHLLHKNNSARGALFKCSFCLLNGKIDGQEMQIIGSRENAGTQFGMGDLLLTDQRTTVRKGRTKVEMEKAIWLKR